MPRVQKCFLCENSIPFGAKSVLINNEKNCMSCYSKKRREAKIGFTESANPLNEPKAKKVKLNFMRYAHSHSR